MSARLVALGMVAASWWRVRLLGSGPFRYGTLVDVWEAEDELRRGLFWSVEKRGGGFLLVPSPALRAAGKREESW